MLSTVPLPGSKSYSIKIVRPSLLETTRNSTICSDSPRQPSDEWRQTGFKQREIYWTKYTMNKLKQDDATGNSYRSPP